ncbi:MAG TPA: bifunctional phosphoribosyl-AMP cyclohydrolase/phosphoribosyl-ATP diphosphatase HisIE [Nitrospirales bacterium]|jgi:phosphoribosyl-ATP pyrophosphohydrolase/phosphoribosyl-AMP cyclohydrolase|nr:bifunctional phosphoribosyl-AMP cyclohydrolase/phosphoribosyl-ATP diphosphatase HisIE [Nitrospirales bacterium]HIB54681.1 bifunctional phosphoribosyl-AMP cyclohydrolase/phosphoribosyl-ATP diphosphatase HisIE [Nitrospirales bacterium]HIC04140.1 bifunctional phosphoribosyl-AMP cyclohydrolase/phosphoribosyl-ATP diphosphatase HisIE [Nitrospirales bacterium]HIO22639.1 bifunctional phosphoribosyl-AMP cyclohydrolase/phosphoribosyl-ATP diphosphatase HisIE [Nitrospirales bacterium]HIO68928.1 bifuncti
MTIDLESLIFDVQGLIPAILQDWRDGTVLMVAYMNREALDKTIETGHAHFWSRSRQELWEKGATSGHYQRVRELFVDCDRDTLLLKVEPMGPACHTGEPSCFFSLAWPAAKESTDHPLPRAHGGVIDRLYEVIVNRREHPNAESYVSSLMQGGQDRMLKKITEEAGEMILGSKNQDRREIIAETTDLLFHVLIVLGYHEIPPQELYQELASRYGISGHRKDGHNKEGTHD